MRFSLIYPLSTVVSYCIYLLAIPCYSQTYKFAELGGSPMSTVGWNLQGAAEVGNTGTNTNNEELILTPAVRSQSGAIFYNTPINLSSCNKWIAEFDFRMAEGSGADGIAFCYLDVPPTGFVLGEGLGIPGVANGLKVAIDTWWNCGSDQHPKVELRWGFGYKECDSMPTVNNNNGELSFIRNGQYHHCEIRYDKGTTTVAINGKMLLSGYQTFNFKGYFGFTSATGNSTDVHSIKNVHIYTDMPPSEAGAAAPICSGNQAQLGVAVANPNYRYFWTPTTGLDNPNSHQPKATVVNNKPDTVIKRYYVHTEFSYNPGCASIDSVDIVVNPSPAITYSAAGVCHRDTTVINPVSTWPDSVLQTVSWLWNYNDPSAPAGLNTSTNRTGIHYYTNSGTYNVNLTTITKDGCIGNNSYPIVIKKLPPVGFTTINKAGVCFNENVKFVQNVDAGYKGFTSIFPDAQAGSPLLKYNKLIPKGDTVLVNFRQVGVVQGKSYYVVKWSNTDTSGCVASALDTIKFKTQPIPTLAALAGVCMDVPAFQLTGFSELSGLAGTGYFSGRGITDPAGIFDPRIAASGNHDVMYIFKAANGCTDTATQRISVYPYPVVSAGPDKYLLPGGKAVLEGNSSITPASVIWSPATGLSNSTILKPTAGPTQDQQYVLKVISPMGCTAKDSVLVKLLPALTVPNAFSPHVNDAINDTWIIRNLNLFPESRTIVFDRYGREVFNSQGYNQPWDGKIRGILVPVGVYYYIVDPKNGEKVYVGSLTVL